MARGGGGGFPPPVMDPVYPKEKAEDYNLMGGINTKVSLYTNGPAEFRDLSNLNFINLGALTKRPGTTLFGGTTLSGATSQITSGYEYQTLSGNSYLIIAQSNEVFQFNSTGASPIAFFGFGATLVPPSSQVGSLYSFVTFVDKLFMCNGYNFWRIGLLPNQAAGVNTLQAFAYSLPSGTSFSTIGVTYLAPGTSIVGLSGTFVTGFSFVNDRGFIGPPTLGVTVQLAGTGQIVYTISDCINMYNFYGATAIQLYRSQVDGVALFGTTLASLPNNNATTSPVDFGYTLTNTALAAPNTLFINNQVLGSTVSGINVWPGNSLLAFSPRFLEVFNNQLFMAGFSTAPSTFYWSQIGEPEGIQPNFNVGVRSNDGDIISGMKNYFGSLFISKRKSIHLLSGTDPTNFLLQQLSDQYGCLSHRAIVPWNNVLWFLDSKGIIEYNGANIRCVSTAVEPIFTGMNIQAAYDNACGMHVKRFNEIWFAIPANGSTINNQIVVYDYMSNAWTHYDGIQAQCLFNAFAGFSKLTPFAGGYTGGLVYFDPTLNSDNDQGITCSFNSLFFAARGQTTENLYRRFYLNMDPVVGITQGITLTFQTNYGTTVQLTRSMFQNPYQSRIDFGLSARSIQASMYHFSASLSLKINGFTVESRYQRNV